MRSRARLLVFVPLLVFAACGDGNKTSKADDLAVHHDGAIGTNDLAAGDAATGDLATVDLSSPPDMVAPVCGDGVVGAGEACDDGNTTNGDTCDNNCTVPACGNGIVDPNEGCDDGNIIDADGCEHDCKLPGCGNGIVDPGEVCGDGNMTNGDACDNNCTVPACGNGIVDPAEACDDGNAVDGDTCETNCTLPACGNGIVDTGEACDDGNTTNGDTCDNNCTVPACGNGIVDPGEACDDGNAVDGDLCETNCTAPVCGNGIVDTGEACDDGNTTNSDMCDNNCTVPACGNGIVDSGERCDDGNTTDNDGCDTSCVYSYTPELLYYRFDETGTTVTNFASSPPTGTATADIMGGITQGGAGLCGGVLIGTGVTSSTDYLNTHFATSLTTSWTISLWTSNITPSSTLFYVMSDATASSLRMFTNGVAGPNNWILRGPITDVLVPGGATVAPHLTTFVYDSTAGTITGYLDGVSVVSVSEPTGLTITGTGPFKVMGYSTNVGSPAGGEIDDFKLFSRALTAAEVASMYAVDALCK